MHLFKAGILNMRQSLHSAFQVANPEPAPARNEPASRRHLSRPPPEASAEIARYISQMTAEMAGMAGAARLDMLAYFLDMARNEAEMAARRPLD